MKRLIIASLLTTGVLVAQAQTFVDQARVRSVDPQYENVIQPRNECTSHWVPERGGRHGSEPQARQYGGAIVGALAGGVLGNQIGGGSGKDAATVLGVVLGAVTGDRLENRDRGDHYAQGAYGNGQYENAQREVQRCRTVNDTQTRLTGYRVTYEYSGQQYTTFTRKHPGQSLAVRVSVDPIER